MKGEGTVGSGLTSTEAGQRLQQYGPNEAAEERRHPGRALSGKFWAPVPWMLEATFVLQFVLGRYVEASVIPALLVFNAVLGFLQEAAGNCCLPVNSSLET